VDTHYTAFLQMPVILHGEKSEIVEAEIRLPVWYQPQMGHILVHQLTNGLMPLGPVFFDGDRDTIVLTTVGSAYDFTTTLEEWLKDRPQWKKAGTPFIVQEQKADGNESQSGPRDPLDG
jgi:hypothetical protein